MVKRGRGQDMIEKLLIIYDKLILIFMQLFSGKLKKSLSDSQYEENTKAWKGKSTDSGEVASSADNLRTRAMDAGFRYIENQRALDTMLYGKSGKLSDKLFFGGEHMTAADNACEVIAVYNLFAALDMKEGHDLPELMKVFSEKGICFKGRFGTSPKALTEYLRAEGLKVESLSAGRLEKEHIDKLETRYDAYIFMAYNEAHKVTSMLHTMCITKETSGFVRHNSGNATPYTSLNEAVYAYNGGKSSPLFVLGAKRP